MTATADAALVHALITNALTRAFAQADMDIPAARCAQLAALVWGNLAAHDLPTRRRCTCGAGIHVHAPAGSETAKVVAQFDRVHRGPGHGPAEPSTTPTTEDRR